MAGEREWLESLFGVKEDGRWVGSVRRFGGEKGEEGQKEKEREKEGLEHGEEDERRLRGLLDRDMEGCGRPLKVSAFSRSGSSLSLLSEEARR
jgi:conserved oligomeric Golgi complex subunit 6